MITIYQARLWLTKPLRKLAARIDPRGPPGYDEVERTLRTRHVYWETYVPPNHPNCRSMRGRVQKKDGTWGEMIEGAPLQEAIEKARLEGNEVVRNGAE